MQANGRLQRWNSRGLRPQGSVEAARGRFLAAASTRLCGRKPLLFQHCSLPFACT